MAEPTVDQISTTPCHLSGITRQCFSPDGATIFTGGTDCLVRIHKVDEPDSEPGFHDNHTDAITSLDCSSSNLVTGSVDNIARYFSYPENDFSGYLTRSAGVAIRWVSVDRQGERVAVCSDDLLVKIVHLKDTSRVQLLTDNTKSVRSATWDPSGKYLTTASCDGKIKVYDTSGSEPLLLKIMEGIIASSDSESETSCYATWHPSGNSFAVPLRTNDIGIIGKEGWTKQATFSPEGVRAPVGELAWSPNGKYLASASGAQILVWSMDTKQVIARCNNLEGSVTSLSFSPKTNLIAFTTLNGAFTRWNDPIPSDLPSPTTTEAAQAKRLEKILDDDFNFGDDDLDMEKGEDLFGDGGDGVNGDGEDDWIVDDLGGYPKGDVEEKWGKGRTEVVNVTKSQAAFQPGSTAFKSKKRYLAFNMIGVIDVTDQETHNVVNVEFHDKSARRGYHFQDHSKFTIAALGEQGIIYAAPSEGDQPSTIYYRPYDSWASQSEWTIPLLQGEDAVLVAAGGSGGDHMASVVVVTSKGFVRFLSSSGIQRYVWRLGEDGVAIAAGKDSVIIVHREGGTSLDGCQNLRYTLIDLETFEILQESRIPLPRKITLTWLGFTPEGAPAMYDSSGLLSVLDRFRRSGQARWVPLVDTNLLARKVGKSESYWPVGVGGGKFACVILKGAEKEPWFPRPIVQEIDVNMPLLNMDNQQGKLEESMVRTNLTLSHLLDSSVSSETEYLLKQLEVSLDKDLLQLVQGACKADNLSRALDATKMMRNQATVEAAGKVAGFYHLPGLQQRIAGVKVDKRKTRAVVAASNGHSHATGTPTSGAGPSKGFSDFAPRNGGARRTFGGVQRDSTPVNRGETVIPETPGTESAPQFGDDDDEFEEGAGAMAMGSPEHKRRRIQETPETVEETSFTMPAPRRRAEEVPLTNGTTGGAAKNPFAKKEKEKAPGGSNPFARPAVAKPLDAIKSTSFFERVDNIESSGVSKSARPKGGKKVEKPQNGGGGGGGGKQATLFGLKKGMAPPPPRAVTRDSLASTETEGDDDGEGQGENGYAGGGGGLEETQTDDRPVKILQESQAQIMMSPEEEEGSMDFA